MPVRPNRDNLKRAAFRPPPGAEVLTSLWVAFVPTATGFKATLQYDYGADFAPQTGWKLDIADKQYTVTAVNGRDLSCQEVTP